MLNRLSYIDALVLAHASTGFIPPK
ncbi:hypothetical protein SMJ63A_10017 [Stenotrophomonas geniculata]|nr:conserved protein of unknown function [Stenotrophomonas maltophilia]CRD52549.1 hypothetical protein BN126320056 [Stenotrophomonas maltophilia]